MIFKNPEHRRFNQTVFPYGKNAQNYDSALVYTGKDFRIISIRKHLGINIKGITWQNKESRVIVDDGSQTHYYKDIWTKERDYQFELASNYFYWDYGSNLRINRDHSGNVWINPIRGEINFIPWVYLGMRQFFYTNDQTGAMLKVSHLSLTNRNKLVFSTLGNECGIFEMKTGGLISLGNYQNITDIKSNRNISIINSVSNFLYVYPDNSVKKVPKPELSDVRSFDWLNANQILLSEGSVFDIQQEKVVSRKFHPIRAYTTIRVAKKIIVASGISWVDIYSVKTGELLHHYDNTITSRICVFKDAVFLLLDSGGILPLDKNGKREKVFGGKTIFSDAVLYKNVVYLIDNDWMHFVDYEVFKDRKETGTKILLNLTKLGVATKKMVASDDYLYLGTTLGVIKFDIRYFLLQKGTTIPIEFESISTQKGIDHLNQKNPEFKFNDNNLEVKLGNYDYSTFCNIFYEYRLLGGNSKWITSKSGEFNFNNISPGDYVLQVRVAGIESGASMVEYPFRIETPFWKTWWFRILILIASIGIIYLLLSQLFQIRKRFLIRKNALMELEFKALKSQLNPHFIFNSLNTLQSMLFNKDELTTNEYIVSLSKLMRTVLDNSRVDKVSLSDEIDFLKSYVLIHSVKLDTQLDLVIDTTKIESIRSYAVRTMILQPFVENSIVHGLSQLEGPKKMSLTFEKIEDYVFVTIEDNGVGRNEAKKSKNISNQYQSVATSILSEKSILVKQMFKEELDYVYTDLYENGKPSGTKVVIQLKLFPISSR